MTSATKKPMPPIPEGREVEFKNQVAREQLGVLRKLSCVLAEKITDVDALLATDQDFGVNLTSRLSGVQQGINAILGGAGENKIRHRVALEMFGSLEQSEDAAELESSSLPAQHDNLSVEEEAQLRVDQEAVDARTRYEEDRERLILALKSTDLRAEKQPIKDELDRVEQAYSKLWRSLESGVRGAEILAEVQEERRPAKPQGRAKSRSHAKPRGRPRVANQKGPATRIKKNGDRSGFAEAMRELDAFRQQKDAREREIRQFQSMTNRHPFKTNSATDDRIYQTHGARNPRAKKDLR